MDLVWNAHLIIKNDRFQSQNTLPSVSNILFYWFFCKISYNIYILSYLSHLFYSILFCSLFVDLLVAFWS